MKNRYSVNGLFFEVFPTSECLKHKFNEYILKLNPSFSVSLPLFKTITTIN
jgi:hypothetical protein